jgi:hypothetical protein
MSRTGRKRFSLGKLFIWLIGLGLIAYAVQQIVSALVQPTAIIASGDMGRQYQADAVIVRNEKVTDAEGLTRVYYHADEGEQVFKGNRIAEVYSAGYSQTDMSRLLSTRTSIKAYQKGLLAAAYPDQILDRYDAAILGYAEEFEAFVRGEADGNLINLERQLQNALVSRQAHLKSKYINDQNLTGLYETESSLLKKIQSWTTTYLAAADCIVSFYMDGYETMLDMAAVENITIPQVRSVLRGEAPPTTVAQRGRTAVFREVQQSGWYLLLLCTDRSWTPTIGQTYKVRLDGFDDLTIEGQVVSATVSGSDTLVRLHVPGSVRDVLGVRTAHAEVGESYVAGLRVPRNALANYQSRVGVVLPGNVFVEVAILEQNSEYAIIQPTLEGALQEGQRVLLF